MILRCKRQNAFASKTSTLLWEKKTAAVAIYTLNCKLGKNSRRVLVSIREAPPTQLAIIKTPGHSKSDTVAAKGNQLVGAAAKQP